MTALYHYTCAHRAPLVRADGVVIPGHHQKRDPGYSSGIRAIPWAAFAWLTDLEVPAREPLGLTMDLLRCDRTEFRFRAVEGAVLVPWVSVRRMYPWSVYLEQAGARPAHWYVSPDPVPVIESPR